ncbi:MAG: sulfatase-like hydrolase/transferase [Blastocatellia bacterium]
MKKATIRLALLDDWAQYLDTVRYTDKEVGEVIARLEREGVLEQTIIIFMTDHGISHAREKQFLYDGGIHVPFIVRGPGVARGVVRDDLIEHIDMAAISLGLAGLAVPSWMQGRNVFAQNYEPRDAVFSARDRCDETVERLRGVRTERYKYIFATSIRCARTCNRTPTRTRKRSSSGCAVCTRKANCPRSPKSCSSLRHGPKKSCTTCGPTRTRRATSPPIRNSKRRSPGCGKD